jgi:hypothetical protein
VDYKYYENMKTNGSSPGVEVVECSMVMENSNGKAANQPMAREDSNPETTTLREAS